MDARTTEETRAGEVVYPTESYAIIGACFEVYNEKGPGFLEQVYHECLEIEMSMRGISFEAHPELMLEYKGRTLTKKFHPDFLCYDTIIVEIKSVSTLNDALRAQVHNYLKATKLRLGLLVNFGNKDRLEYERIVR
jgi:GxxExxY protein